MRSSYNSFLDNIEVNEKELQRDLQKRKNAEQKRRLKQEDESHYVKPQKKANVNNNTNRPSGNKNTSNKNTSNKVNQNTSIANKNITNKSTTNKTVTNRSAIKSDINTNKNSNKNNAVNARNNKSNSRDMGARKEINTKVPTNNQTNKQQSNSVVKVENAKGNVRKVTQLNNINATNSSNNKSNNNSNNNSNITKERLKNQKIHIRQKKISNTPKTDDNVVLERQVFTISKEEYDQKILGTIKDNQTKMIFFKENQKLAKVPKSVVFLGMYAFALSAVILYSFSRIGTVKVQLKELNKEFNQLNEVNAQLNIKLATAYNIDNIRQRAENELYMNKPEAHQIMYITVVPENNVEYEMGTNDER